MRSSAPRSRRAALVALGLLFSLGWLACGSTLEKDTDDRACGDVASAISYRTLVCSGDADLATRRFDAFEAAYACLPDNQGGTCEEAILNFTCPAVSAMGDDFASWLSQSHCDGLFQRTGDACPDVARALAATVTACTGDADGASRLSQAFLAQYQCEVPTRSDTRCITWVNALACDGVVGLLEKSFDSIASQTCGTLLSKKGSAAGTGLSGENGGIVVDGPPIGAGGSGGCGFGGFGGGVPRGNGFGGGGQAGQAGGGAGGGAGDAGGAGGAGGGAGGGPSGAGAGGQGGAAGGMGGTPGSGGQTTCGQTSNPSGAGGAP
jgi:hypothetical protein